MERRLSRSVLVTALVSAILLVGAGSAHAASGSPPSAPVLSAASGSDVFALAAYDASATLEASDEITWAEDMRSFEVSGALGNLDYDDVIPVDLAGGDALSLQLTGATGTDFDIYLYGPELQSLNGSDIWRAMSDLSAYPDHLTYNVPLGQAGTYYADLFCARSSGSYRLSGILRTGTKLTSAGTPTVIDYRGLASVTATLATIASSDPVGGSVGLKKSYDGASWSHIATLTAASIGPEAGRVSYTDPKAATRRAYYRLVFNGDSVYGPASLIMSVKPRVSLSAPTAPSRLRVLRAFTSIGNLYPRHRAGSRSVRVDAYRLEHGRWVRRYSVWATAYNNDYGGTQYSARFLMGGRGYWFLRAWHPDDGAHASTYSSRRYFAVY